MEKTAWRCDLLFRTVSFISYKMKFDKAFLRRVDVIITWQNIYCI